MTVPLNVIIAEDSVLLREGLSRLLDDAGFRVVVAASDADELLTAVDADPPDVVVVDVRMPPTHTDEGLRAALEIRDRHPGVGVLVLSQWVEERYAAELLAGDTRGVGYLLKDRVADIDGFVEALHRVQGGARRSTRRSSPRSWPGPGGRRRSRRCPRASATCSR